MKYADWDNPSPCPGFLLAKWTILNRVFVFLWTPLRPSVAREFFMDGPVAFGRNRQKLAFLGKNNQVLPFLAKKGQSYCRQKYIAQFYRKWSQTEKGENY